MKFGECQTLHSSSFTNTCINPIAAVAVSSSDDGNSDRDKVALGMGVGIIGLMCLVLFCGLKLLQREEAKRLAQASAVAVETNAVAQQAELDKDLQVPGVEDSSTEPQDGEDFSV